MAAKEIIYSFTTRCFLPLLSYFSSLSFKCPWRALAPWIHREALQQWNIFYIQCQNFLCVCRVFGPFLTIIRNTDPLSKHQPLQQLGSYTGCCNSITCPAGTAHYTTSHIRNASFNVAFVSSALLSVTMNSLILFSRLHVSLLPECSHIHAL